MLIVDRQQRVLAILRERKAAQIEEIARELDVSTSTIRRDLETLEQRGLVERIYGGAMYVGGLEAGPHSMALASRMEERVAAKQAIGAYAASLVQPNMTLFLDGGSTVVYAARQITARPIQVVTVSLSIAALFKDDEQVELILVGGTVYPRSEVTVGPIATSILSDLHADLLLFSLAGIYGESAFNMNMDMARVEQVMLQQATNAVMLMDSAKFGRKSLSRVCHLADVDQVVTDAAISATWRESLGSRLVVVGNEQES